MKVKLVVNEMEKGVQKLKRSLVWFSNMVGLMDKGRTRLHLVRGSEIKDRAENLLRRLGVGKRGCLPKCDWHQLMWDMGPKPGQHPGGMMGLGAGEEVREEIRL